MRPASLPHDTACDDAEGTTGTRRRFWALRLLRLDSPPLDQPASGHALSGSMQLLHCHTTQHVTVLKAQPGQRRRFWALRLLRLDSPPLDQPASGHMPSAQHAAASLPHDTACDSAEGTTRTAKEILGPSTPALGPALLLTNLPLAMPSAAACQAASLPHDTACDGAEGTTRDSEGDFGPFDYLRLRQPFLSDQPALWPYALSAAMQARFTATRHSM